MYPLSFFLYYNICCKTIAWFPRYLVLLTNENHYYCQAHSYFQLKLTLFCFIFSHSPVTVTLSGPDTRLIEALNIHRAHEIKQCGWNIRNTTARMAYSKHLTSTKFWKRKSGRHNIQPSQECKHKWQNLQIVIYVEREHKDICNHACIGETDNALIQNSI